MSILWHWNAPTGLYDTPENPWYSGFYTRATDFDIAATLADPTGANYTLLIRDIDAIAYQLKRLQTAGVPVLWRPLHEAEGGWFWWGAKGAAPAKALYKIVYERLTKVHGLNNLIWVWNSVAQDWYPGDEVVDIVSTDVYAQGNGPMSVQYNELVKLGQDKKMVAAAEVGAAPKPDLLVAYEAHWLWFCVWGDGYADNKEWNSLEVLKEVSTSVLETMGSGGCLLTGCDRSITTTMSSRWTRSRTGRRLELLSSELGGKVVSRCQPLDRLGLHWGSFTFSVHQLSCTYIFLCTSAGFHHNTSLLDAPWKISFCAVSLVTRSKSICPRRNSFLQGEWRT